MALGREIMFDMPTTLDLLTNRVIYGLVDRLQIGPTAQAQHQGWMISD